MIVNTFETMAHPTVTLLNYLRQRSLEFYRILLLGNIHLVGLELVRSVLTFLKDLKFYVV